MDLTSKPKSINTNGFHQITRQKEKNKKGFYTKRKGTPEDDKKSKMKEKFYPCRRTCKTVLANF